jgi:sulfite reductase (NADPH) hemoprotein beta-component
MWSVRTMTDTTLDLSARRESSSRKDGIGAFSGVSGTEPLARLADIEEYRAGLQPNVHMIRIKIPGGRLPLAWARRVAEANRRWGGTTVHISTRQDLQMYYVRPDDVADVLEFLAEAGITTREACGNTLRNMTSCSLSGICPREHVNAAEVADRLALSWIRHPLAQHMPRKFKITVSGCETDCGGSHMHDLGLVATQKDGKPGFKAFAGGGTGGVPYSATLVSEFVEESELPAVVEALLRVHQKYSNRRNRNKARIKFVLKRFGPEKFRALFEEEFARSRTMPQRPWTPLEWRQGDTSAPEPISPGGRVAAHDGTTAIVVDQGLGLFTSDEMDKLADIAEAAGSVELLTTREQNLVFVGVAPEHAETVVDQVRDMGFMVEDGPGDVANVVACPGTSSCGIGITNSQNFGGTIQDRVKGYAAKPNVTVKISGCQNGCGLHHVADFGFRGMGKKIGGRNAPHYQIYLGGAEKAGGQMGLPGPVVPARLAEDALQLLLDAYADGRKGDEDVRDWALRLGKEGLRSVIGSIEAKVNPEDEGLFFDFGEDWEFTPPAGRTAECAAGVEDDDLQKDLADDAIINVDRALNVGAADRVRDHAGEGFRFAAQRLRIRAAMPGAEDDSDDVVISTLRTAYGDDDEVIKGLDAVVAARAAAASGEDAALSTLREALAYWIDLADEVVARPAASGEFNIGAFGDSGGRLADILKGAPGTNG